MREGLVSARDGRKVAFAEFGDPAGRPLFVCHGSFESRRFEAEADWTAARHIRVITPDRPGFGGSDPLADRTLLGWPRDLEDLANELGIDDFAIIGWSGGGPHTLAAAHELGRAFAALALVGSFAPFHLIPGAYEAMAPELRMLADIAPADPRGTAAIVAEFAKSWIDDPDSALAGDSPPEDQAIESHPEWGPNLRAQVREGLRRTDGVAWDAAVLYGHWGFTVDDVRQPTDVWHGTADDVTPSLNGEWLARTLPDATLRLVPGGHFILYSHWREIVTALVARLI